jgi:hypothetical protein
MHNLSYRYGIGEWYGRSFVQLAPGERGFFADLQFQSKKDRPIQPCLPRSTPGKSIPCNKPGGVCSLRLYRLDRDTGEVSVAPHPQGGPVTTCPQRFLEGDWIFNWIGQTLLGHPQPTIVGEIGFLERERQDQSEMIGEQAGIAELADQDEGIREDVGRIDNILVHPERDPLHWCAMEIQAVYFSGTSMSTDFRAIQSHTTDILPFPAGMRRPDYRSSGPKRLMPQLQIKVPALRRWGKKMAVVVDQSFFNALGTMDDVPHISNCDIAWFVVKYDESGGEAKLIPDAVRFTTLERAVEGLTAGRPVSLDTFERRILRKLGR